MSVTRRGPTDSKPELLETHQLLIAVAAVVLMVLPFLTAMSDAVDAFVTQFQWYVFLQDLIAPTEGKLIAAFLQYVLGITTFVSGSSLIVIGSPSLKVYISWICVGWQSAALLAATLIAGLRGPYTLRSKGLCLVAAIEGTFVIGLLRMVSVILVDLYVGHLPAVIYHDYGGTVIMITWLVLFWYFAFAFILKRKET
jgi:exosortase/archaeosortase family protein